MKKTKNSYKEQDFRTRVGLDANSVKPVVCVQGLGFVGAAMAVAVAKSVNEHGDYFFDVIGLDRPNASGLKRISSINEGVFPFSSLDKDLDFFTKKCCEVGNLCATTDVSVFEHADVVVVDVNLDVDFSTPVPSTNFESLKDAIKSIGQNIRPDALVLVETTVPPGTCERIILPVLQECFNDRGLDSQSVMLAHSYERVMPGPNYLKSITDYWRVYSGINNESSDKCLNFLKKIIDTNRYPPRKVSSVTASETAKVLENTFRAVNIALIDEWSQFSEYASVDLHEVIEAIRDRPTHLNIRQPGFGVGGYCLTKDPLFASIAQNAFFPKEAVQFQFANLAIKTNQLMPIRNLDRIISFIDKPCSEIRLLMLGIAYKADIDDTRYSAAEVFYRNAGLQGIHVEVHDPIVKYWHEVDLAIDADLPNPSNFDAIVFCVPHQFYRDLDVCAWLGDARPLIYDCDNALSRDTLDKLVLHQIEHSSTGRGK